MWNFNAWNSNSQLQEILFNVVGCVGDLSVEDEFIGIALDGNPIYGPNASDKTDLLKSSDLDACHGRFVDGKYRYHITADFPYTLGCYKGEKNVL